MSAVTQCLGAPEGCKVSHSRHTCSDIPCASRDLCCKHVLQIPCLTRPAHSLLHVSCPELQIVARHAHCHCSFAVNTTVTLAETHALPFRAQRQHHPCCLSSAFQSGCIQSTHDLVCSSATFPLFGLLLYDITCMLLAAPRWCLGWLLTRPGCAH